MNVHIYDDYQYFRSTVAQKKLIVSNESEEMWTIFDAGPKSVKYPLIFLPPCSGTADIFFKQLLFFSSMGFRAISVNYPVIWNHDQWCLSFNRLLEKLSVYQIHIFGASLGGFLGQKFAEFTSIQRSPKVLSLILCNTFTDTSIFKLGTQSKLFWMMPRYILQNHILTGLQVASNDYQVQMASDFVKNRIRQLSQSELASRLTLNCQNDYINPELLQNLPITVIDVCDPNALTLSATFDVVKCYPNAKRGHMKSGGNFPYISRSGEVNLFIEIHLKAFIDTPFMPQDSNIANEYSSNSTEIAIDMLSTSSVAC